MQAVWLALIFTASLFDYCKTHSHVEKVQEAYNYRNFFLNLKLNYLLPRFHVRFWLSYSTFLFIYFIYVPEVLATEVLATTTVGQK